MADITVVPLGAGQDVGRSCILVTIGGKRIMFDCGMHMGYQDERRFPDFTYISREKDYTSMLDAVIITHFHLDHCGALPYFTEMCGYDGPIYMTHPTKAICPILLEDFRKISVDRKGETNFFTSDMIKNCMKKVIAVNIHQSIMVDDSLEIRAYYAGHVLGAAMFYVRVGNQSVVYTGDYNMTPDRHLGAAWIDRVRPDLLITETTYATTIRDSKRARERDFLKKVHDCVSKGGKVLIPCFALGRAQELCILIDTYWERTNLKVPVYFSAGMTEKANNYYKLFINWTNEKIKKTFTKRNAFDFLHIQPFERSYADQPGPMVLFATPGMLHAGTSYEVFKKWAGNEKNMLIMPGYCVAGTLGAKVLAGQKIIEIDRKTTIDVRIQVKHLSFSAHADAKGIMQLIRQCEPKNVMLVHGEKAKMGFLKQQIIKEFGIGCYDPPNGMAVTIATSHAVPVELSARILKRHLEDPAGSADDDAEAAKRLRLDDVHPRHAVPFHGLLVAKDGSAPRIVEPAEAQADLHMPPHQLSFSVPRSIEPHEAGGRSAQQLLDDLFGYLREQFAPLGISVHRDAGAVRFESIAVTVAADGRSVHTAWSYEDDELGARVVASLDDALRWRQEEGAASSDGDGSGASSSESE